MDMGMDMGMSMDTTDSMVSHLHFTPSMDTLWFDGWVSSSTGALIGACIGLFMLAILERLLAGVRGIMETWWRRKMEAIISRKYPINDTMATLGKRDSDSSVGDVDSSAPTEKATVTIQRSLPPFIVSHDVSRSILRVFQAFVGYALMLAVMTFNASYILSILIGTLVGELLFGRFA